MRTSPEPDTELTVNRVGVSRHPYSVVGLDTENRWFGPSKVWYRLHYDSTPLTRILLEPEMKDRVVDLLNSAWLAGFGEGRK